ncbi:MAG: alpha/beta hydrolase [Thermodesulfobacteriota bacterium]
MPLDDDVQMLMNMLAAPGAPTLTSLSVEEARANMRNLTAFRAAPEPIARVEDRTVPGPAGDVPVRIYAPRTDPGLPVLVYFHGGGWVLGDLDTHDGTTRALAKLIDGVVVSVDYRLAPEHKFPAAIDDAYAATEWVVENAAAIGGDPRRVAIAGDSAGGNLTACVALKARDHGKPRLVHQLLIYPVTDARFDTVSYRDNAEGYFLTRNDMEWFWNHYLRGPQDATNPYASPLQASDLRGLPPATVITAEFDPLRDEGEAYAARLREAGVPTQLRRYDGVIHGFFSMGDVVAKGKVAMQEATEALRRAFIKPH